LDSNGVVMYPTEGSYALGANALEETAIKKDLELTGSLLCQLDASRFLLPSWHRFPAISTRETWEALWSANFSQNSFRREAPP